MTPNESYQLQDLQQQLQKIAKETIIDNPILTNQLIDITIKMGNLCMIATMENNNEN